MARQISLLLALALLCGCHISITTRGARKPPNGTIYATASPANGGQVNGAGDYPGQTTVPITAVANSGWTFSSWMNGDTSPTLYVTVKPNSSLTYTAYFSQVTPPSSVSIIVGWNQSPGAVSYRVYQGGNSGSYSGFTAANGTTATLSVPSRSTTYIACTAVGSTGLESPTSNEISYVSP